MHKARSINKDWDFVSNGTELSVNTGFMTGAGIFHPTHVRRPAGGVRLAAVAFIIAEKARARGVEVIHRRGFNTFFITTQEEKM